MLASVASFNRNILCVNTVEFVGILWACLWEITPTADSHWCIGWHPLRWLSLVSKDTTSLWSRLKLATNNWATGGQIGWTYSLIVNGVRNFSVATSFISVCGWYLGCFTNSESPDRCWVSSSFSILWAPAIAVTVWGLRFDYQVWNSCNSVLISNFPVKAMGSWNTISSRDQSCTTKVGRLLQREYVWLRIWLSYFTSDDEGFSWDKGYDRCKNLYRVYNSKI